LIGETIKRKAEVLIDHFLELINVLGLIVPAAP